MKIFVAIVLLAGWVPGLAQNLSNRGKEFWVGYGHHQFMEPGQSNSQEMILYFSAEQAANVTVTVKGRTITQVTNYSVPANSVVASNYMPKAGANDVRLYDLPPTFGGNGGEGVFDLSIHIESDVPIVAYSHIFGSASSGATMLMPVETWGYVYSTVNAQQQYASNCFSWVYVMAQEDNTVVEITPSVLTRLGKPAGVPFTVTLNKGQVYQVIGAPQSGSVGFELTGTKVISIANGAGQCYPVAVFAGSSRTSFACPPGGGSGDNFMQQIFPFHAWGKRYLTAPTSSSTSASSFHNNSYRIAVKDPTTVVKRNGVTLTGLVNNFYYEFQSSTADYIEADKPILVAQYMSSSGACGNSGLGDPEVIYISPIEQAIKRIGFYRNTRESITINYLTLIIPTAGLPSLTIDGANTFTHTYAHPNLPDYTVVVRRWSAAQAQCIVQSDSAFTAITYGLGSVESYGCNAGTLINNLSAKSAIHNIYDSTASIHEFTCKNTSFDMSVLMAYKPTQMVWQLSTVPNLTPNADVTVAAPVPVDSPIVDGIKYYRYTLPGTYIFTDTGTYEIPILATHPSIENCNNTELVKFDVIVKGTPVADFTFSHSGCTLDLAYFTGADTTSNNYTAAQWYWELPGPVADTGQNITHLFVPGTHNVKLTLISAEGCVSDTTKSIIVYNKPPAEFAAIPDTVCLGTPVALTDTATAGVAINAWYWDMGDGFTVTDSSGPAYNYTFPAYGTYTVKHATASSVTCVSDTVTRTVHVYAVPEVSFTWPSGCIASSGLVQFNNTTTVADGQTFAAWNWNFDDPNATPANPNTSVLQDPAHNFSAGTYDVNLSAETQGGCVKDTTISVALVLYPAFAWPPLADICGNEAPVSIATATVTNGATGTGVYHGPGTATDGMFDPVTAGPGTHTIWYVYTATGNCADSVSQTITVHAAPQPGFTYPTGCLDVTGLVQLTNTSSIADAQTLGYLWNFDDPNAGGGNPNTSAAQDPVHNFQPGTYNINLSVTSSNGCVEDSTVAVTFNLQPLLAYAALTPVCENISTVSVATAAVTNGVAGTGVYKGPGTDAAGIFSPGTAGAGVHTIWYVFTSGAGCTDSISQTITVHPKPDALFTATSDICLGEAAAITDQSNIPAGNIVQWNWSFGDGNTSSYNNNNPFTHSYNGFKNYTIKLVAISNNGCVSDSASRTVAVHAIPVAGFDMPAAVCMPGGNALFTNRSITGDNASMNYVWGFGDGSPASAAVHPNHVYADPGSYTVTLTATTVYGCMDDYSRVLSSFYSKPVADFEVNKDTLCQGEDNLFTDLSAAPNSSVQSWNWQFGDGAVSTQQNPLKRYNSAGSYDISLTVTNMAGCQSDPYSQSVIVYTLPVIDAGPSFIVPQGTQITFNPTVNDSVSVSFMWTPGSVFTDPAVLRPSLIALYDQTYTLMATGGGNCTATDNLTVKILKPVKIPNAFSPNGDGVNDTWIIENLADYPGAVVEVYNRYGQIVYRTTGYAKPWDGTHYSRPLPVATYYYVIQLKNGFAPMTGSVTIVK